MSKKSYRQIILEEEEPLFDTKGGKEMEVNTPDEISDEKSLIRDPSFDFEVTGNFDFRTLEKFLNENEMGLEPEKYVFSLKTKGEVSDEDYENFIKWIEDKLTFLRFEK